MSVNKSFDFSKYTSKPTPEDEFVPSQLWLNIGYSKTVTNEDGEEDSIFVSLVRGIPLDAIQPKKITGKNQKMNHLHEAQNELLRLLKEVAESSVKAGDGVILDGLQVELRRVGEQAQQSAPGENPLLMGNVGLKIVS